MRLLLGVIAILIAGALAKKCELQFKTSDGRSGECCGVVWDGERRPDNLLNVTFTKLIEAGVENGESVTKCSFARFETISQHSGRCCNVAWTEVATEKPAKNAGKAIIDVPGHCPDGQEKDHNGVCRKGFQ